MFQGILLQVVFSLVDKFYLNYECCSHYDQSIPSTNIVQNPRGRPRACWCLELTDALHICMLTKAIVPFFSLRKTVGKVSPILVTLTSRSDSDFGLNVSLKENKPDSDMDYYVRKNEGKLLWFSTDCFV